MQHLKPKKVCSIKQKLICATRLEILLKNDSLHTVEYEVEEVVDGVKPKLLIKIRRLKKKFRRKSH